MAQPRGKGRKGQQRQRGIASTPAAVSARAWATWTSVGTTHVQDIRHATAELILHQEFKKLVTLPSKPEHLVAALAVDETGLPMLTDGLAEEHIMVLHASVLQRLAGERTPRVEELALAPCILENIKTKTLLAAILSRFGSVLRDMKGGELAARCCLVFTSDSASTLCKLGRHFAISADSKLMTLHARCMMHMFFASCVATIAPLGLVGPMF